MKHHTKEEKKEILDALREGRSMQDVTKAYDVSYASIHRWQLTEGETDIPRQSYTLKEKAEILIAMEEAGLSDTEAAATADVNISTIRTWKRAKPRILAAYYAQGSEKSVKTMQAKVMQSAYGVEHEQSECENTFMDRNEERALKKENEYLKAKNAYLESLLESLGYEPGKLKKKEIRGNFKSKRKRNRQYPPSLFNRGCVKEKLLCLSEACGAGDGERCHCRHNTGRAGIPCLQHRISPDDKNRIRQAGQTYKQQKDTRNHEG